MVESTTKPLAASGEIIKSQSDTRTYKYITLPNKLQCILIQDDEADKSSASLDVSGVGAASDPKEFYGTAHFLEHMLFMGSKKYPEQNDYAEFIKNNGGRSNAYTGMTYTNYHFDVSNEAFEGALDRFSQFFLSPLLGEESTEQEMKAVDSEYNMSTQNDSWRMLAIIFDTAKEQSAMHRFMCGSLETLKKEGIRENLLAFHKKYYSSNIMHLVVTGRHSIAQLEEWVVTKFSGVENKNVVPPDYSKPEMPFDKDNLGQIMKWKPIKDKNTLEMYWILPYVEKEYKSKPLNYFSHLLGHEGENSILSYLKQEDLGFEVSSGADSELGLFSDLTCTITLTEKGVANVDQVVQAVFKYAQRIAEVGPQEFVFNECKTVGTIKFNFQEKTDLMQYCIRLASKMHLFETPSEMENLIRHMYTALDFDPTRIKQIAACIADPGNTLCFVNSQKFDVSAMPLKEKWYNIDFSREKYGTDLLTKMQKPVVANNGKKLDVPPVNTMLPKNFDVLKADATISEKPSLIKQWEETDLWVKKDDKFQKPKATIMCKIYTSDLYFGQTPKARVFAMMWQECLASMMTELNYSAEMAAMRFDLMVLHDNVNMQWSGFNDSLGVYVQESLKFIDSIKNKDFKEVFEQVKAKRIQELRSHYLQQTFRLAHSYMDTILLEGSWEQSQIRELLEPFTYEQFKEMQAQWLKTGRMLWYVYGNIQKENAIATVEQARQILKISAVPRDSLVDVRCLDITANQIQRIDFDVEEPTNDSSCLITLFQFGLIGDGEDGMKKQLLNQIVHQYMDEPFFNQLRTIEQLGYVVLSRHKTTRDVLCYWIMVQSEKQGCSYLRNSMDKCLAEHRDKVKAMSNEDFCKVRDAVLTIISEKDKNQTEDFSRNNMEIAQHRYQFDRQDKEIAMLKSLTLADFQSYYERMLFTDRKRIDMRWNSQKHKEEEANSEFKLPEAEERSHKNLPQLKKAMGLYPDNFKINYCYKAPKL